MNIDKVKTAIAAKVPRLRPWEVDGIAKHLESEGLLSDKHLSPPDDKGYVVKNREGHYLVSGNLNGMEYDGQGKAYRFTLAQARVMEDNFGFTYEPAP